MCYFFVPVGMCQCHNKTLYDRHTSLGYVVLERGQFYLLRAVRPPLA